MSYILKKYQKYKTASLIMIGLLAISFIYIPYIILGEGSYIQLHDQMDGEILNYIYQAKYFGLDSVIPEFMNGMSKLSMIPPAPFGVAFYLLFEPFMAYTYMQIFILVIGFIGMFLLCKELQLQQELACIVAVLFCYMPFYPTYGLSALGQPLLVYAFICLWKQKNRFLAIGSIIVFAGFSSLTLVGYIPVMLSIFLTIVVVIKFPQKSFYIIWGTVTLVGVYITTNFSLIKSILGTSEFISHREEMLIKPIENWIEHMLQLFFIGGSYSKVYSVGIVLFGILSMLCMFKVHKKCTKPGVVLTYLVSGILIGTVLAIMWNTVCVSIRVAIGGFVQYFQADRIYWTFPFVWMLAMGFVLQIFSDCMAACKGKVIKACYIVLILIMCLLQGYQIFRDSTLNKNLRLLFVDGYEVITWESFYMPDVFEEIENVIDPKTKASVVSLGMYPSIALYHGYTCADGYSNNYDLAYKHTFREVIEDELAQSKEMQAYFDDWGNRLYFVESEYGFNPIIAKNERIIYENVEFNLETMKAMNIRYIFSAAPISFVEEQKISLIDGSPFSSEKSYYEVWIYEIL